MKKFALLLLITCLSLTFFSCPEAEPDFVGTWEYTGDAGFTQTIIFTVETYTVSMDMGVPSSFEADIIYYDEDAGHIHGEITSATNMGDWAGNVGDSQYMTYEITGDVMLGTDHFNAGTASYPPNSVFDGTEGVDYFEFTKQ